MAFLTRLALFARLAPSTIFPGIERVPPNVVDEPREGTIPEAPPACLAAGTAVAFPPTPRASGPRTDAAHPAWMRRGPHLVIVEVLGELHRRETGGVQDLIAVGARSVSAQSSASGSPGSAQERPRADLKAGAAHERCVLVSLTTDFGDGAYVGALRGSILQVAPDTRIVDVTHHVPAHDVVQGAIALLAAAPYFPRGTVHVCVVDPGVGTARRPVVVEADGMLFVGPDNGVLMPAAERMGFRRALLLDKPEFWRTRVSPVFHGRDIFGPVAAHLARGVDPSRVGTKVDDPVRLDFGHPKRGADGALDAKVLTIDSFGNVTTNVPEPDAPPAGTRVSAEAGSRRATVPMRKTYGEASVGEDVLLVGSSGFVELAVSRGRADERWGLRAGDGLKLRW